MNKYFLAVLVVALCGTEAFAAAKQDISPNQGSDSCGLGWQVTDKRTFFGTTTRGTTNFVIPSSFGMTSGTIGCEKHEIAKNEIDAAKFATVNFDALTIEMAQGEGEYINGLAAVMGCSANAADLGKLARDNYKTISEQTSGIEMYKSVRTLIRKDSKLSASCAHSA